MIKIFNTYPFDPLMTLYLYNYNGPDIGFKYTSLVSLVFQILRYIDNYIYYRLSFSAITLFRLYIEKINYIRTSDRDVQLPMRFANIRCIITSFHINHISILLLVAIIFSYFYSIKLKIFMN